MDLNQRKELFSNAYVRAVAATAGYSMYQPEVDDDSVDWGIGARGGKGTIRSPKVELQLKCTGREVLKDEHVAFPLEVKNYEELRHENYQVPRILVVVVVPSVVSNWLIQSEESLAMHHCGYWISLRGMEPTENVDTITVHVPRKQVFSVDQLTDMMERIRRGGVS